MAHPRDSNVFYGCWFFLKPILAVNLSSKVFFSSFSFFPYSLFLLLINITSNFSFLFSFLMSPSFFVSTSSLNKFSLPPLLDSFFFYFFVLRAFYVFFLLFFFSDYHCQYQFISHAPSSLFPLFNSFTPIIPLPFICVSTISTSFSYLISRVFFLLFLPFISCLIIPLFFGIEVKILAIKDLLHTP